MEFLDRLPGPMRERLLAAGRRRELRTGEHIIRRGERGGDIFLVEDGAFEVVDTRATPEVVLDVAGPGTVVGEMAFLDAAPRGADVRASGAAAVRVWEHELLHRLLEEEADFAAAFYRALAETTVDRMRNLASTAVVGGMGTGRGRAGPAEAAMAEQAREISSAVARLWGEAELRLRRDRTDAESRQAAVDGFRLLVDEATRWLGNLSDAELATEAGAHLARELRPYLVRATLAERALDPPSRQSGDPRLLAHVLLDAPTGEGELGTILDGLLLELPTCRALRLRTELTVRTVAAALEPARPARVVLLNATCGAILAGLVPFLGRVGAEVRAVDGSRDALAFLDAGLTGRPRSVRLTLQQADPVALAMGQLPRWNEAQDLVVVDGLVEYLPDRLVAALLGSVRERLAPGGLAVVTGLADSPDAAVFDHLLDWPTVRRPARELRALVETAGLNATVVAGGAETDPPAVVVSGRRPQ